jgi:hypothetical protein
MIFVEKDGCDVKDPSSARCWVFVVGESTHYPFFYFIFNKAYLTLSTNWLWAHNQLAEVKSPNRKSRALPITDVSKNESVIFVGGSDAPEGDIRNRMFSDVPQQYNTINKQDYILQLLFFKSSLGTTTSYNCSTQPIDEQTVITTRTPNAEKKESRCPKTNFNLNCTSSI